MPVPPDLDGMRLELSRLVARDLPLSGVNFGLESERRTLGLSGVRKEVVVQGQKPCCSGSVSQDSVSLRFMQD